jgi:hypothetical protein
VGKRAISRKKTANAQVSKFITALILKDPLEVLYAGTLAGLVIACPWSIYR